jgi:hypothetical protein
MVPMVDKQAGGRVACAWCLLLAGALLSAASAAQEPAVGQPSASAAQGADDTPATDLGAIHVIAITPQQGADLPETMIPYNVQSTTSGELDRTQTLSITDYMNRNMTGVTINSATANPLQPNLQFRGFTASPLLGGSQACRFTSTACASTKSSATASPGT